MTACANQHTASPQLTAAYQTVDFPLFSSHCTTYTNEPLPSSSSAHFDTTYEELRHLPAGCQSPAMSASHHSVDMRHFAESNASAASTVSSTVASPAMSGQQADWAADAGLGVKVVPHNDGYISDSLYHNHDGDTFPYNDKHQGFVVPSMIDHYAAAHSFPTPPLQDFSFPQTLPHDYTVASSVASSYASPAPSHAGPIRSESAGPGRWQPYTKPRAQSIVSVHSKASAGSDSDEHKTVCPIASCQRLVRDVKAHMLTHQNERPEKCPISSCPYHVKGFARKYDKNRHTLTHFKGTMVCDFCPSSGTPSEKSFNRTDVFKRHLQSVHSVEQTTPIARRRKPSSDSKKTVRSHGATCRTCGGSFPSAQDLYDHIDECALRDVQQAEPSEAINEQLLTSVADDAHIKAELTSH